MLEEARVVNKLREDYLHGVLDNAFADPTQTDDTMSYATARSGNIRGSSSASASAFIPQQASSLLSTESETASAAAASVDIPFEEESPMPLDVKWTR